MSNPDRSLAHLLLVLLLLFTAPAPSIANAETYNNEKTSQQPARTLEPGQTQTFELNTEEKQEFRLLVTTGEFLHIVADQNGIDFSLKISGPTKAQVIAIESGAGLRGTETLSFIAQESGEYFLEVRPNEKGAPTRSYTIRVDRKTTISKEDQNRAEATLALATAQSLLSGPKASHRLALEKYSQAVELWRGLSDPQQEAAALMGAGKAHRLLEDFEKTKQAYEAALAIWRANKNAYGEAQTLNDLGRAYFALGHRKECLQFHDRALSIFKTLNELSAQSSTLNFIGITHNSLINPDAAIPNFTESLHLAEKANDRYRQNAALLGLGGAYDLAAEFNSAISFYQRALILARELNLPRRVAITLNNIAVAYDNLGEWKVARENYEEALVLRNSLDKDTQIQLLANVGMLHSLQGDTDKAVNYYEEGLLLQKETDSPGHLGLLLDGLGLAWARAGDYEKAKGFYQQAIPLHQKAGSLRGKAYTLTNFGGALAYLGDVQSALQSYQEALAIWNHPDVKDPQGKAYTLDKIGDAYLLSGKPDQAVETYRQALVIWEKIKDPRGQASSLLGLARAHEKSDRLDQALVQSDAALNIVESQRTRGADEQLRMSYLASKQEHYEFAVKIRMRLHDKNPDDGYNAQAWLISERFRARSLIDTLTKARVEIRQGVDPALREQQANLQKQMADKEERSRRFAVRGKKAEAEVAEQQGAKLSAMVKDLQARIRSSNPHYANLTQPEPISLSEIQRHVLNEKNTVLLEFMLGEEKSYLWVVSHGGKVESHVLPPRREIERKALAVKCLLTSREPRGSQAKSGCVDSDEKEYWTRAAELSDLILRPIANLTGNERLVIVADGELQYLPFGALPRPNSTAAQRSPLFLKHEIVYEASASTLALMRSENAERTRATKTIAVIADPVFEPKDSRLLGKNQPAPEQPKVGNGNSGNSAARDSTTADAGPVLARLQSSGEEAQTIQALVRPGQRLIATGFAANRDTATSPQITQYRTIHFATHAVINDLNPELSGIALSRFDANGRLQPNSFLRLQDIYNLNLPSELIVLSACNTALGRRVKGEGLMSLTRGFMYAGSKSVVSSLWQVEDDSTARLMRHFYRHMLKEGMKPAAALRAAQIDLWKESPASSPYYWGAFIIQGEWR